MTVKDTYKLPLMGGGIDTVGDFHYVTTLNAYFGDLLGKEYT